MPTDPPRQREPLISVIMPCRDGLPYVLGAVDGVLAQNVPLELLFVDAGSTDGSREAVASLHDYRVRILDVAAHTPPGVARNLAAGQARADLLAFADADDLWRSDKLERQLLLRARTGAGLLFSDCRVVDGRGRPLGLYLSRHRPAAGWVRDRLLDENFVPLSTVLVDRLAFEKLGGFADGFRVACDYLFMIQLSEHVRFAYDPEALVDYRIHARNLTGDFRRAYAENEEVFRRLIVDAKGDGEVDRLRAALGLVQWRWALRELLEGPGSWGRALGRVRVASGSAGVVATTFGLVAALRGGLRGLPLRVRMARARHL